MKTTTEAHQEEWRVIPDFPDYEITVLGGIRRVDNKESVDIYMGRIKPDTPLHPRVRLTRSGVRYPNAMRDLIKSAFKVIPRSVIPAPKPKKIAAKPKEAPIIDQSGLDEKEWRVIPDFPKYRITADGYVRSRKSGKLIRMGQNNRGATFYTLWLVTPQGEHKNYSRSPRRLIDEAFPEFKVEPKPKVKPTKTKSLNYIMSGEWRVIPDYPNFELHETGAIRFSESRKRLKFKLDHNGNEYINLTNPARGFVHWLKTNLIAYVYPEKGISFVPDTTEDVNWRIHPTHSNYEVNYDGQVRHRVKKQILKANRYGRYALRTGAHKLYWNKDRYFTQEEWDVFWNEDLKGQQAA